MSSFQSNNLKCVRNIWLDSIFSCANGGEIVECPAEQLDFIWNFSKMQLKTLWIDLQLNKIQPYMIPCDKFDP